MNQIWSEKYLIILLYFGYILKDKYRILEIFTFSSPSFLVIENLQNHIIFKFLISLFSEILSIK